MDVYTRLLGFVRHQTFKTMPDIDRLQRRTDFGRVMRAVVLAALCRRTVNEHQLVLQVGKRQL